jgi:hypothetical protein
LDFENYVVVFGMLVCLTITIEGCNWWRIISSCCCVFEQSGLTLSSDGILGPLGSELPDDGVDLTVDDIPSAVDI